MMLNKYGTVKRTMRLTAVLLLICMLLSVVCVAAEPDYTIHTVASGDTLGKIAKLYGVTVNEIAELNNITNINIISVGTELKIPGTAPETTAEETTAAETEAAVETEPEISAVTPYEPSYSSIYEDMSTVISVNFNQTDIRDVLSAFAVNLGCNFIFKGTAVSVTLVLNDVTVGEALDYVMKLINMTYITDGRTIIVGEKQDLIKSFSEALQLTEFSLTYVTASTIMSQIAALEIAVTVTSSGDNEYRFIAQGLPVDLSKVRDLIQMIDKRENSMIGPAAVASFFYTIELKYITAAELQKVLASVKLPTGITLAAKPLTLYVYAGAEDYKLIMNICKVVDTSNPAATVVDAEQPVIKQINLRYVTLELIESQITANSEVSIIKIATNKATFWLNGKLAQIKKAEEIITLLDTETNAAITSQEIKDLFRPITLKFITAEQFNTILSGLSLPAGLIFPDNAKTLFIYASADEFTAISDIQAVVDKEENNAGTASVFRPVELRYITAEQFNTTLSGLSLPNGIIFPNNEKTLFIFATPEQFDAINDMQRVVDVPSNSADIETQFITVVLRYITAEQFNTTLASLNLPTGIIYSDNENTLYINATYEEEDNINKIKSIVDVPQNNLTAGAKFRYITLRYMTADQFNETLKSMSLPTGLTFPQNQYTLYLNTTASEYRAINDIRAMVDAPQNTLGSGAELYPITLRYITAKQFNTILASVKLPTGTYFKDSDKTMFVNATLSELNAINNIKNIVDSLSGASSVSEFRPVTLRYITAEQFNSTLGSLSLPQGITYTDNKKTLYIFATPDEFVSIDRIKTVVDTPENAAGTSNRNLYIIELVYITADKFNTILTSMSLPKGILFKEDNKNMLYLNVSAEEYTSILDVKSKVDTAESASSENTMVFEAVPLDNMNKDFIIPFVKALGYKIDVVELQNMQKVIWLKGPESEVAKAIVEIDKIKNNSEVNVASSFRTFLLKNISADEMSKKLAALSFTNVVVHTDILPALSRNILVSFPNDMEETIADIISSLDLDPSQEQTERVTLMIDSADGAGGESKLWNRISIISLMSGISEDKFAVSSDISKTDVPMFVLYLKDATLAEIKLAREIVGDLGSGSGGTSAVPVSESIAAFNMITVGNTGYSYEVPIGTDNSGIANVNGGYQIAQTETTYELWSSVIKWALNNGYAFQNVGREGSDGVIGAAPTTSSREPVTDISWRDIIVWLNALSELKGLQPVYRTGDGIIIRDSKDLNAAVVDNAYQTSTNGYRLPSGLEWEMAAKWIDSINWTWGSYASGANADYNDEIATGYVAWYSANSNNTTNFVKSKAPNTLGLYDMSGNVWEWCYDFMGSSRIIRGGSWSGYAVDMQVGLINSFYSSFTSIDIGFRIAKNP
ncbi:MAG: SUMF1/EgtB/PvdO family nonheme iron enzyme [Eubacteriales bacterium]